MSGTGEGKDSAPGLKRAVSRWEIVGLALNDVIGSGVYLLPATAAAILGPASVWAVLAAGFCVLLIVLCFAEAASHFDGPGSAYLYTRHAFGDFVGFEVGWMTWLARVASLASLSAGFAQALGYLWPGAGGGWGRVATITVPVVVLAAINVAGVKSGTRTAVVLAVCKILPLVCLILAGLIAWAMPQSLLAPIRGADRLGEAAMLLLFAYAGFENTAAPAGEFKNPRRDVPFALIAEIAIVTVLYSSVQFVALGALPNLAGSQTPLADAGRVLMGPVGGWLLTIGAAISILGTNSNTVLAAPRYLFALARDGFGPRILASIHPSTRTPAVAVVTHACVALPLALSGSFVGLAALSVVVRLVTYIGTAAAVPVLRRKFAARPSGVRLPGGAAIPVLAILVCVGLAASTTTRNLVAAAAAIAIGAVIYSFRRQGYGEVPATEDSVD